MDGFLLDHWFLFHWRLVCRLFFSWMNVFFVVAGSLVFSLVICSFFVVDYLFFFFSWTNGVVGSLFFQRIICFFSLLDYWFFHGWMVLLLDHCFFLFIDYLFLVDYCLVFMDEWCVAGAMVFFSLMIHFLIDYYFFMDEWFFCKITDLFIDYLFFCCRLLVFVSWMNGVVAGSLVFHWLLLLW